MLFAQDSWEMARKEGAAPTALCCIPLAFVHPPLVICGFTEGSRKTYWWTLLHITVSEVRLDRGGEVGSRWPGSSESPRVCH